MIKKYKILPSNDGEKETYVIWADCGRAGFSLPPIFERSKFGATHAESMVYNLTQWYGLPIEEEMIMSHFINQST